MGGFYNIVLIIYLYVVHVIICNPRNSASGCNVVSILIIIIIIITRSELVNIIFHWIYTRPELVNICLFLID